MERDDARAWRIARSQMWLITLAQLRECGFSISAVKHRLRTGRLWRVYPGVYAVGHPQLSRERRALAAVLGCGPTAGQCLMWAAFHLRMWEDDPPRLPQVAIPTRAGNPGPSGIELHRWPSLATEDVRPYRGIPTTTVHRTLADNAAHLTPREIKSMLRQAQRRHKITLSSVRGYLDNRPRNAPGSRPLRDTLATYLPKAALTKTEREAMFFDLCETHGLPLPEPQFPVAGLTADFAWPLHRLITELDDRDSHEGQIQHGDDLVRDRTYRAAGWHPERFTVAEAVNQPAMVAEHLRPLLAARGGAGS